MNSEIMAAAPAPSASKQIAELMDVEHPIKQAPLGHALVALAKINPKVVGLSADLAKYTDLHIFAEAFPDRFFEMGMSEQLMMTAAGGLAKEGFIPFASTYGTFAARRGADFINQAVGEQHANVKIIGGLPGLTSGYGPSHQATDDLAIMRAEPNMVIIDPCDAVDVEQMVPAVAAYDGPVYMRILRGRVPCVLDEYDYHFEMGKAKLLVGGSDVIVMSTGLMTMRALDAAKILAKDHISVAVLHIPTVKPLDVVTIVQEARRKGRLVVIAENHTVIGGLGEAIAAVLMRAGVMPEFRQIALPDEFLAPGSLPMLHDRYGLSTKAVVNQIRRWL